MARVLVLDVIGDKGVYEAECNELKDFYEELRCNCFDIANRNIGGKRFDLFVDDIGLFRENPIVSVWDMDMKPMLVGNVVFANHDSEGNTTSLSDEDIELIKGNMIMLVNLDSEPTEEYKAIFPADY